MHLIFKPPFGRVIFSVFALAFLLFNQKVSAQTSSSWVLDTTMDNIECYHMITQCSGQDAVLLKFVNNSKPSAKISWDSHFITNLPQPVTNPLGRQTTYLTAEVSQALDCVGTNKTLYITAPDIDVSCTQISQFKFANITIE